MIATNSMTKDQFKDTLKMAHHCKTITNVEVDLLFHSLDSSKDGVLQKTNFKKIDV